MNVEMMTKYNRNRGVDNLWECDSRCEYPPGALAANVGLAKAHMMGELKRDIMADPERFVDLDEELPLALMDLRAAGKKVLLITNSEWFYTRAMMS